MSQKVQNQVARKFIEDCGAILKLKTGTHYHYKRKCVIVTIPTELDIDYSHLEAIAIEQFDIPFWQFDYLLGQCGISPNTLF